MFKTGARESIGSSADSFPWQRMLYLSDLDIYAELIDRLSQTGLLMGVGVMGVERLLQYCTSPNIKQKVIEKVDLVEEAKSKGGITLLVDLSGFQLIIDSKLQALHKDNKYLAILGGEYNSSHDYVKCLINKLRAKNIDLVFYADGSKSSISKETEHAFETQTVRYNQHKENTDNVIKLCNGLKTIDDLKNPRPGMRVIQSIRTIEECGCVIKKSTEGGVDSIIAKDFIKEQAYAILSLDTDFCIFKDCCLITGSMFDLENDLDLDDPQKIMTELLKSAKVMQALGFTDHDLMVELSIMAGNDFTKPHMKRELSTKFNLAKFESVVDWVKQYKKVEYSWQMHKVMEENCDFKMAVETSRAFYGNKSDMLQKAASDLPPKVMDINKKIYWHQVLVEDNEFAHLCVEDALQYLRAHIYRILLPKDERVAKEFKSNSSANVQDLHVAGNRKDPNVHAKKTLGTFVQKSIEILKQQLHSLPSICAVPSRKPKLPPETKSSCHSSAQENYIPIVSQEDFDALNFPLSDHVFKLKCQECENKRPKKEHTCYRDRLCAKNVASLNSRSGWIRIRRRPGINPKTYKICSKVSLLEGCVDACSYAHSDAELRVWMLDMTKRFSISQFMDKLKELNISDTADMENITNAFNIYQMLLSTNKTAGQIVTLHVMGNNLDIDVVGAAVSQITRNAEHIASHVGKMRGNVISRGAFPGSVKTLIESLIDLLMAVSSQREDKYLPIAANNVWAASDKISLEFETRKDDKIYQESKNWKQIHLDLLVRTVCRQFVDMRAATVVLVNLSKEHLCETTDAEINIWQQFQGSACMLKSLIGLYDNVPCSLHEGLESMNTEITKYCISKDITTAKKIEQLAGQLSTTIRTSDDSISKMMHQALKNVTENRIAHLRQKVWALLAVFRADLAQQDYVDKEFENATFFEKDCFILAALLVTEDGSKLQKSKDLLCVDIPKFVREMRSANAPDMYRDLTSHLQRIQKDMFELVGEDDMCKIISQELLVEGNGKSDEEDRIVRKIRNMQGSYRRKIFKFVANKKGYIMRGSQMTSAKKKLFISLDEQSISLREHYIVGKSIPKQKEDDRKQPFYESEIDEHLSRINQHMADVESLFTESDEPNIDAVKGALVEICSGIETLKATVQNLPSAELTDAYNALVGAVIDLLSAVQPWSNPVLAVNDSNLPTMEQIDKKDSLANWQHFHYIISHFEPDDFRNMTTWFTCCSGKDAFKLYILRYFLRINWNRNLHVTRYEFEALMALVFGKTELEEKIYQAICLRPTTRCLTLGSWFQNVYKHAFDYLGHLLYLSQDFPDPREVFCGSAWTVFFTCSQDKSVYESEAEDVKKKLRKEKRKIYKILKQNREFVQKVTKDIY